MLTNLYFEITRKEIINGIDDEFIHHGDHTLDLKKKLGNLNLNSNNWKLENVIGSTFIFKIRSATDSTKMYENKISLVDEYNWLVTNFKFKEYLITNNKENQKKLVDDIKYYFEDFIKNGNILCSCSCPAFLYFGYKFMATNLDYVIRKDKENRSPDIRNPGKKGTICKHLDVTLRNIVSSKNLGYLVERISDNFLKLLTNKRYKKSNLPDSWWRKYFIYFKK